MKINTTCSYIRQCISNRLLVMRSMRKCCAWSLSNDEKCFVIIYSTGNSHNSIRLTNSCQNIKRGSQLHPKDIQECSWFTNSKIFQFHMIHFTECFRKEEIVLWKTSASSSTTYPALNIQNTTLDCALSGTHQAAPTTDREMAKPMPRLAHMKGEVSVRNLPKKRYSRWRLHNKHAVCKIQSKWLECLFGFLWLVSDENLPACCTFYQHLADGWC